MIANPSIATAPEQAANLMLRLIGNPTPKMPQDEVRRIKTQFIEHMSAFLDDVGICCFTEEMQNPILWAHYAGSYSGICAEFRTTDDRTHLFSHIAKVAYTSHRPTIRASQTGALQSVYGGSQDWGYIAQHGICTKSEDWSVEKEWRWWITDAAGSFKGVPERAFRRIFLGPHAKPETKYMVVQIAKGVRAEIAVFETKLSLTDFRVERGTRLY